MARDPPEKKVGSGHLAAMGRLGFRELQGLVHPGSNIAQQPEYGSFGNPTPGEVAESRRSDAVEMEEERGSVLQDRLKQAEASRDSRGREDRSPERD